MGQSLARPVPSLSAANSAGQAGGTAAWLDLHFEVARPEYTAILRGHSGAVKWDRDGTGLTIELPSDRPSDHAFALEISPVEPARTPGSR